MRGISAIMDIGGFWTKRNNRPTPACQDQYNHGQSSVDAVGFWIWPASWRGWFWQGFSHSRTSIEVLCSSTQGHGGDATKAIEKSTFYKGIMTEIIIQHALSIGDAGKKNSTTKLYGYFFDNQHIYLIMEYAPGGTLYEYYDVKGQPSEQTFAKKMYELCKTVKYIIHSNLPFWRDQALSVSAPCCQQ